MPNLLIVSDNENFKEDLILQIGLYASQFNTNLENEIADIIILDEKQDLVADYVKKFSHTPILVLLSKGTEKPQETDLIKYKSKPISLNLLIDDLNSAINLAANSQAGKLSFNKYELSIITKEIINLRNNETIKLTEKEVSILQYLYKIKDRIVTKTELLQEVWEYNPEVSTHTIETHIYRLRQKVEQENKDAQIIITEEGGYLLKR